MIAYLVKNDNSVAWLIPEESANYFLIGIYRIPDGWIVVPDDHFFTSEYRETKQGMLIKRTKGNYG